jgi:hypothetical protein
VPHVGVKVQLDPLIVEVKLNVYVAKIIIMMALVVNSVEKFEAEVVILKVVKEIRMLEQLIRLVQPLI